MCNIIQVGEEATPWKIRFGEDLKGPKIPFGCQIDYWTGPRKRPKPDLKYEPTSKNDRNTDTWVFPKIGGKKNKMDGL